MADFWPAAAASKERERLRLGLGLTEQEITDDPFPSFGGRIAATVSCLQLSTPFLHPESRPVFLAGDYPL